MPEPDAIVLVVQIVRSVPEASDFVRFIGSEEGDGMRGVLPERTSPKDLSRSAGRCASTASRKRS